MHKLLHHTTFAPTKTTVTAAPPTIGGDAMMSGMSTITAEAGGQGSINMGSRHPHPESKFGSQVAGRDM